LRVLFDKNVPYQIRRFLTNHEVRTAAEQGRGRIVNGDLLRISELAGFQVMVTCDQNLKYQQNLKNRELALVVLGTNKLSILKEQPERIVSAVDGAAAGSYQFIEYRIAAEKKTSGLRPIKGLPGKDRRLRAV